MFKRPGSSSISLLLPAMLDWCKKTATRSWQAVSGIVRFRRGPCRSNPSEDARPVSVGQPSRINFCGEDIEVKEILRTLTIGDRLRVLCDDGVLVAEKISQTQFKFVSAEGMSKLIH